MGGDDLALGQEACARHDWTAARDHLSRVDPARLSPDDLRGLSTAAYLIGDRETAVRGLQRAYAIDNESGDHLGAARDAHWLAMVFSSGGEHALVAGWVARGNRLLEDHPEDVAERGYLLIHEMFRRLETGDFGGVLEVCEQIDGIGRRCREPDLTTFARSSKGRMLLYAGRVPEGLALLDEAMVSLAAGEVSPLMAGPVYCSMIEGCQEISDHRRMTEWTDALTRWCDAQPDLVPFTGQCAVHRGQILRAHGDFAAALDELALAAERYAADGMNPASGLAAYERGEVLRLIGDFAAAEAAYDEASSYGHEPQPGLSLLWLARGRTSAAVASAHRLLDDAHDPVTRSRRLGAVVEILVAGGELDAARVAAEEYLEIAHRFGCDGVTAAASHAAGLLALAEDDPGRALGHLRAAWRVWIGLGDRYDAARARAMIGVALRALGDEVSGVADLAVSQRTFAELGAEPDRRATERLIGVDLPDGLTAREVEVLRLVARGRSNPEIAEELHLSQKTVARHLSNIFGKTAVTSRTAAAAYAFEHDLMHGSPAKGADA